MVLWVELRVPPVPPEPLKRALLEVASRDGLGLCPRCGADRSQVLSALCSEAWEDRAMAWVIVRNCRGCAGSLARTVAQARTLGERDGQSPEVAGA